MTKRRSAKSGLGQQLAYPHLPIAKQERTEKLWLSSLGVSVAGLHLLLLPQTGTCQPIVWCRFLTQSESGRSHPIEALYVSLDPTYRTTYWYFCWVSGLLYNLVRTEHNVTYLLRLDRESKFHMFLPGSLLVEPTRSWSAFGLVLISRSRRLTLGCHH